MASPYGTVSGRRAATAQQTVTATAQHHNCTADRDYHRTADFRRQRGVTARHRPPRTAP